MKPLHRVHYFRLISEQSTGSPRDRRRTAAWRFCAERAFELVQANPAVRSWITEVSPKFRAEFFDGDGDMICPNGNVELVQALLAGWDILRGEA